ncbi:hypothetical protein DPMN_052875 [Dreissena polymorpha]|uniref:Uncharacterized protein n=1 Tax=Dreissena polymorpha TaxID=45954 RepID=A0A9D4HQ64_DREPO|nr:hypothetical protein DPMN_052875 [Dreissena polymorpha]
MFGGVGGRSTLRKTHLSSMVTTKQTHMLPGNDKTRIEFNAHMAKRTATYGDTRMWWPSG